MGKVEAIYLAAAKQQPVTAVATARLEAGKGIVGDRYHRQAQKLLEAGKAVPQNHVTLIAREELDNFLQQNQSQLGYGEFRRNIITTGIDLNALVGQRFTLGSATCLGVELCEPCATLAATVHRQVLPGLVHRGGLRATVVADGEVEVGAGIAAD